VRLETGRVLRTLLLIICLGLCTRGTETPISERFPNELLIVIQSDP